MERAYRLYQDERGLGMSGIILEDRLEIYKGDELIATFDQYWLFHDGRGNISDKYVYWNQDGTKVGFYGLRYPDGTFPNHYTGSANDDIECHNVVCYLDIETKEVKEHLLKNKPLVMTWDNDDKTLLVLPDPVDIDPNNPLLEFPHSCPDKSPIEQLRKAAQYEFTVALDYFKTFNSPDGFYSFCQGQLYYYLTYYDPSCDKESAFKYCVKRRNEYLRSQGLPVPYGEDILD